MPNPCCCGPCSCVGCIKIQLFNINATSSDPVDQDYVDGAYNRTVTAWRGGKTTRTPYDLFDDPTSDCSPFGLSEADYPGTRCVYVADLCCDPDLPTDPPSGGDPTTEEPPPPPPPPPGPP